MTWWNSLNHATQVFLVVFVLALLATLLTELIYRGTGHQADWPISRIFKRAVTGAPDLLALSIGGTVLLLVLTGTAVPDVLYNAFLVAMGYYFRRPRNGAIDRMTQNHDAAAGG